jgi:hypothetical protein
MWSVKGTQAGPVLQDANVIITQNVKARWDAEPKTMKGRRGILMARSLANDRQDVYGAMSASDPQRK